MYFIKQDVLTTHAMQFFWAGTFLFSCHSKLFTLFLKSVIWVWLLWNSDVSGIWIPSHWWYIIDRSALVKQKEHKPQGGFKVEIKRLSACLPSVLSVPGFGEPSCSGEPRCESGGSTSVAASCPGTAFGFPCRSQTFCPMPSQKNKWKREQERRILMNSMNSNASQRKYYLGY